MWPILRSARTFRVYVVEPKEYKPDTHASFFNGAVNSFVSPQPARVDPYALGPTVPEREHFDLITFPEAFLPQAELVAALRRISMLDTIGCIHVGLRPTCDQDQLLFTLGQIRESLSPL